MGEVINLYQRREQDSDNALSVVREFFDTKPVITADLVPGDKFLMWLWGRGYKVVPLDDVDK